MVGVTTVGQATFTRILVRCHSNLENLIDEFRKSKLDWVSLPSELATRIEDLKIPEVKFVRCANPSCLALGFNTRHPPLDQLEVRQALNAVIDRSNVRRLLPYEGISLDGPPGYQQAPGSTESAISNPGGLLSKAGLVDADGDGFRDYQGKSYTLAIYTNQENLLRKLIADAIAESFAKIGIRTSVVPQPWSDLLGKHLKSGNYDAFLMGFYVPRNGSWLNLWHSAPSVGESLNFTGFATPELNRILENWDLATEPTDDDSARLMVRKILASQVPMVYLFQSADVMAFAASLEGPTPDREIWEQDILSWSKPGSSLGSGKTASQRASP